MEDCRTFLFFFFLSHSWQSKVGKAALERRNQKKKAYNPHAHVSLSLSLCPLSFLTLAGLSLSRSPTPSLSLSVSCSLSFSLFSAPSLNKVLRNIDRFKGGHENMAPLTKGKKNYNPRCATSSKVPRDGCVCVCVFSPVSLEVCSLIHAPPSHASRVATPVRILWVFCMHAASPHPPESTLHLQRHTYHVLRTAPMFAMMGLCVVRVRCGRDERGDRKRKTDLPDTTLLCTHANNIH